MAEPSSYFDQFRTGLEFSPQYGGSALEEFSAQAKRKAETTISQQVGAMFRQDNTLPGLLAWHVGSQFLPEEGYSASRDKKAWAGLTAGVQPQFQHELLQAVSPAHAEYLKGRLLEKQKDLQTLGDLDSWGNAGRFSFGLLHGIIDPINIPTMVMGTPAGFLGKVAMGVAGGVAQERVRQRVNFENDYTSLLDAGLTAGLFSVPFAALSAHGERVAAAARAERALLEQAIKDAEARGVSDPELPVNPLVSAEARAAYDEAFDAAEEIAAIRKEAEMRWMEEQLTGAPKVDLQAEPGATPVRVKLDGEPPPNTAMRDALAKVGLVEERLKREEAARAAAEAEERVRAAAAKTAEQDRSWKAFFEEAKAYGEDVMLRLRGVVGEVLEGLPRKVNEVLADMPAIDELNRVMRGTHGLAAFDARPVLKLDPGLEALRSAYASRFGRKLVFFRDAGDTGAISGAFMHRMGDTLLVHVDAPNLASRVAFHEFFHSLRANNPAAYARFVQGVEGIMQNSPDFVKRFTEAYRKDGLKIPNASKVQEEMFAELVERLVDDLRLSQLIDRYAEYRGPVMRMLADLLTWLEDFVAKLGGGRSLPDDPELRRYISDINQFRRNLARFIDSGRRVMDEQAGAGADLSVPNSRIGMSHTDVLKRTPELQEAMRRLRAGEITKAQYAELVNLHKPVEPYASVPEPIGADAARHALANGKGQSPEKAAKFGAPMREMAAGEPAQLRLDIPAYSQHGAWVVSVHRPKGETFQAGTVVGYEAAAAVTAPQLGVVEKAAANIAEGSAKATIATIRGGWDPVTPEAAKAKAEAALNDPSWVQVGMDPERHSYFYDRSSMRPVVAGSEALQIGPLVLIKDPVYADADEFMFAATQRALAAPVVPAAPPAKTPWLRARWDYVAAIFKGNNEAHKEIISRLVRDPLGAGSTGSQGWTASEYATLTIRRHSFPAHMEMQKAFHEAADKLGWNIIDKVRRNSEFYEAVSRVKRGDTTDIDPGGKWENAAAEVQRASAAADKAYKAVLEEVQKQGWEGAAMATHDPKYVNRQWRQDRIKEAINRYGQGVVIDMLANSFTDPQLRGDKVKAEMFLKAVMSLEYSPAMRDLVLHSGDMKRLRFELDQAGLSPTQIDLIVQVMLGQKTKAGEPDAGQPTNLRFRMGLDESYAHQVRPGVTLRMADFFENDIRVLMDSYVRALSGYAGLAKVGYTSHEKFAEALTKGRHEHETGGNLMSTDSTQFTRNERHLNDIWDYLTGRPMSSQTFNRMDRFLAGLRGWTRGAMLGQLGVAQALELTNAAGMAGLRAAMAHSPTFASLIKQAREGRIADDLLQQDLEHMFGVGLEHAAAYVRNNEVADFGYQRGPGDGLADRVVNAVEQSGNRISHGIDVVSGNRFFTSYTRALGMRMGIQQMVNWANGRADFNEARLKALGIDTAQLAPFKADLQQYALVDTKGTVVEIDWENWSKNAPETYEQFQLVAMRRVRDMIQDHDIGETMPWMHTSLGKVFAELRTFMLVAHAKQFVKNVHFRDAEALRLFTISFAAQALGYVLQTSMNTAGDKERREQMLAPDRIVGAAIQRMSVTGLLPMVAESGFWVATGGRSLFQGGSVNTDNRNFLTTPSMVMAGRALDAAKVIGGTVNPWSEAVTTQKEARSAFGVLPGSNTYLMRNLIGNLVEDLPKGEPMKQ